MGTRAVALHGSLGLSPRNRVKQPEIIMVNTYNQSHCLGSLQVGGVNCPVTLVKWVSFRQVTDTVSKTRWTVPIKHRLTSGLHLYESTNLYLTCKKGEWVRRGRERGMGWVGYSLSLSEAARGKVSTSSQKLFIIHSCLERGNRWFPME